MPSPRDVKIFTLPELSLAINNLLNHHQQPTTTNNQPPTTNHASSYLLKMTEFVITISDDEDGSIQPSGPSAGSPARQSESTAPPAIVVSDDEHQDPNSDQNSWSGFPVSDEEADDEKGQVVTPSGPSAGFPAHRVEKPQAPTPAASSSTQPTSTASSYPTPDYGGDYGFHTAALSGPAAGVQPSSAPRSQVTPANRPLENAASSTTAALGATTPSRTHHDSLRMLAESVMSKTKMQKMTKRRRALMQTPSEFDESTTSTAVQQLRTPQDSSSSRDVTPPPCQRHVASGITFQDEQSY